MIAEMQEKEQREKDKENDIEIKATEPCDSTNVDGADAPSCDGNIEVIDDPGCIAIQNDIGDAPSCDVEPDF